MKKALIIATAVIVVVAGFTIRSLWQDATFRRELSSYTQDVSLGASRSKVEAYFVVRGVTYTRRCCIREKDNWFTSDLAGFSADLVMIGHSDGLVCTPTVYIAFEFNSQYGTPQISDEGDTLKDFQIIRAPGPCL